MASEQNVYWMGDGVDSDTPQTVMTTRAPAVLTIQPLKDLLVSILSKFYGNLN